MYGLTTANKELDPISDFKEHSAVRRLLKKMYYKEIVKSTFFDLKSKNEV